MRSTLIGRPTQEPQPEQVMYGVRYALAFMLLGLCIATAIIGGALILFGEWIR